MGTSCSEESVTERRTRRIFFSDSGRSPTSSGVHSPLGAGDGAVRGRGVVVRALGRTALAQRRGHPGGQAARRDEEAGVPVHPVLGPDRQPLEVPAAHQRLPGLRLGEATVVAGRLGHAGQLGGGGDVADEHPAGGERVADDVEALPGREHVQDDPVDRPGLDRVRQRLDQVADGDRPGGVLAAEERPHVALGDVGEVLAALEGVQHPVVADGTQQGHAERTRAHPGLDHAGAREDVGHGDDLAGVLGVDHRRAAGHRQHVVRQQRPDREVLDAGGVADRGAVGRADQLVVGQVAAVGVELLPGGEGDGVQAALGVGQLDALTLVEGPAPAAGPRRHGALVRGLFGLVGLFGLLLTHGGQV